MLSSYFSDSELSYINNKYKFNFSSVIVRYTQRVKQLKYCHGTKTSSEQVWYALNHTCSILAIAQTRDGQVPLLKLSCQEVTRHNYHQKSKLICNYHHFVFNFNEEIFIFKLLVKNKSTKI